MSTVEVGVSIEEEGVTVDTAHRPLPSKSTKGDSLDSSGWQAGTLAAVTKHDMFVCRAEHN